MLDVFGEDYVDLEFSKGTRKPILDSVFLGRSVKVSMVAKNYEKKFSETDFDYKLDLGPLSKRYPNLDSKILFDLTAGLWNKSIAKDKDEFIAQWVHNLIKLPEMNSGLYTFWHYGLKSEIKDGSYRGMEVGDYLMSKAGTRVIKYLPGSISSSASLPRSVLMPFFRDSATRLEAELGFMSDNRDSERRRSVLYGALREMLESIKHQHE
jgi:hypothetical protein